MVKKIINGIILVGYIICICLCVYSYRKYRQSDIQSRRYQELTDRITEENTRLKNAMSDIRESVDGIRESTGELEELNGKTISGIDGCILQLKEIRKQVYILEKYCDSVDYNIGCNIGN